MSLYTSDYKRLVRDMDQETVKKESHKVAEKCIVRWYDERRIFSPVIKLLTGESSGDVSIKHGKRKTQIDITCDETYTLMGILSLIPRDKYGIKINCTVFDSRHLPNFYFSDENRVITGIGMTKQFLEHAEESGFLHFFDQFRPIKLPMTEMVIYEYTDDLADMLTLCCEEQTLFKTNTYTLINFKSKNITNMGFKQTLYDYLMDQYFNDKYRNT